MEGNIKQINVKDIPYKDGYYVNMINSKIKLHVSEEVRNFIENFADVSTTCNDTSFIKHYRINDLVFLLEDCIKK